jgi:cobalt-zinc-cadmium efflux system membrane fusion protein
MKKTYIALTAIALTAVLLSVKSTMIPPAVKPSAEQPHEGHKRADEGVELSDAKIAAAGIELLTAGPETIRKTLSLNGILQPNQETLVQVTPRFAGVVKDIRSRIGDRVEKGDLLARVESNQSLTAYDLRVPLSGTIIDRQASLGEFVSEQKPVFTIADLSTVWVDVAVYRRDLNRVKLGDKIHIDLEDGGPVLEAPISYISPVGSSDTQSALARAVVDNRSMRLRPGLFVTAKLVLAARSVPLAVKAEAIQTYENRPVIFVRDGDRFEVRDVELGERTSDFVEVLFGLMPGDVYAAKNSFIIKSEMSKGSAAHDH